MNFIFSTYQGLSYKKALLKNVVEFELLQADAFRGQRFSLLDLGLRGLQLLLFPLESPPYASYIPIS
ncbi:hypothetical protein [Pseudalkalibacillus sp. SCS-8]|uniref:hypothetical protein n=1 Tax=Pseudalkalibacillus nanhaiensis TaxID=3115291 RepID=UPI0032DB18A4